MDQATTAPPVRRQDRAEDGPVQADDPSPRLQRSSGALRLSVVADADGRTRIRDLGQDGCLKLRFPRALPDAPLEAVMVNVSGGVAAGDRLSTDIVCRAGTRLTLSGQASERCYRARSGDRPACISTTLTIGPAATLEWLPQETILFDQARLDRALEVEMAADARFLAVESRVFGRTGSGERVRRLWLRDGMRIRRAGRLLLCERLRWEGDASAALSRAAVGGGATSSATIVLVAPDVQARLEPLRAVLAGQGRRGALAAASCWNGLLVVRVLATQDLAHREMLRRVLRQLRDGRELPRVWQT